ncbi:MAG: LysM peptidoglycan-binding domain-containing protein [Anaerolineae bacterium]|nr:LysM peptidoglycan-binding domain-containing protein [Anaerolineae bacterium]
MNRRQTTRAKSWPLHLLMLVLLLVTALPGPVAVYAQGNLLNNPNFEQAHGDGVNLTAPPGWNVWANTSSGLVGRQLQVGQEVVSNVGIHQGGGSFDAYKGWSTYNVSLFQTVSGLQAGSTVRLAAFGRMWSCDSDAEAAIDPCITSDGSVVSESNTGASFRVGIDPNGGNDPNAGGIVWSNSTSPYTSFQQMTVEAAASGGSVTVVLNASMQQPARHQHVFWDTASLTVVTGGTTGGGESGAPAPTAVPALAASVQPQAPREDGSIVHIVQSGDTLAAIAVAYDMTLPEILDLNGMTMDDARILRPGQELLILPASGGASSGSGGAEEAPAEQPTADSGGEGEAAPGEDEAPAQAGGAEAVAAAPTQRPIEEYEAAPVADAAVPPLELAASAAQGQVCALLFDDGNTNRLQDGSEGMLSGGEIMLSQAGAVVGTHTTDGSEPFCFTALVPGSYLISLVAPAGYGVTTPDSYTLAVGAGGAVEAVFGAAQGYTPPPQPAAQAGGLFSDETGSETDTASSGLDMLLQYSGVIVLVLAGVVLVGGVLLVVILRR